MIFCCEFVLCAIVSQNRLHDCNPPSRGLGPAHKTTGYSRGPVQSLAHRRQGVHAFCPCPSEAAPRPALPSANGVQRAVAQAARGLGVSLVSQANEIKSTSVFGGRVGFGRWKVSRLPGGMGIWLFSDSPEGTWQVSRPGDR